MSEKVFVFGAEKSLVGILTAGVGTRDLPAVILLNAGLVHRVGPYRLHVDFARRMAAVGFDVFRFDQSGIGDSEPRKDMLSYEERAVADVREAMDHLTLKRKRRSFILVGLCSGAVNAHRAAVADDRVAGVIFLDGYAYRSADYWVVRYGSRALSPKRWQGVKALLSRAGASLVKSAPRAEPKTDERAAIFEQENPPQERIAQELCKLARRGAKLLFVYTGGQEQYINHRAQFFRAFPQPELKAAVDVELYASADHTFTLLRDREILLSRLELWLRDNFKIPPQLRP